MAKETRRMPLKAGEVRERVYDQLVLEPEQKLAIATEDKMRRILQRTDIDPTSRMAIYFDYMYRYSKLLFGNQTVPHAVAIGETPSAAEELDDSDDGEPVAISPHRLVNKMSTLNKNLLTNAATSTAIQNVAAKNILAIIDKTPELGINSSHELLVNGQPVPDSNITHILSYLVSNKSKSKSPPGSNILEKYLTRKSVLNRRVHLKGRARSSSLF